MKRNARATIAVVAAVMMTPMVVKAEPMMLTAKQMDSITAAAQRPEINVNVAVIFQIANAIALSFAIGPGASASNFVAQSNAATIAQLVRR